MREEKGITLVSLVVTIIILIILAGVSINLTLGENGIITMTKQAKENTELAKIEEETMLNELYTQIESEGGSTSYDSIAKLTEFKKAIADYIEEAGGVKPEYTTDTISFGESIKGIVAEVTKDATATAKDIANGKTAWVNGELITGTNTTPDTQVVKGTFIGTASATTSTINIGFKPSAVIIIGHSGYGYNVMSKVESVSGEKTYGNVADLVLNMDNSGASSNINETRCTITLIDNGFTFFQDVTSGFNGKTMTYYAIE